MEFRKGFLKFVVVFVALILVQGIGYVLWRLGGKLVFDLFFYFGPVMVAQVCAIFFIALFVGGMIVGPIFGLDLLLTRAVFQTNRQTPAQKYWEIYGLIVGGFCAIQILANGYMSVKLFPLARQFEASVSCGDYNVAVDKAGYAAIDQMDKILQNRRFIRLGDWYVRKEDINHACDKRAWTVYLFRGY